MSDFIAQVSLFIEQKPESGEDCKPVLRLYPDDSGLLAVFDGAGGAGGTFHRDAEGNSFTGAFLASRLGKRTIVNFFDELKQRSEPFEAEATMTRLEARFKNVFKEHLAAYERSSASKIKSSLIRHLPTTVAAIYYELSHPNPPEKSSVLTFDQAFDRAAGNFHSGATASCAINVFWAGDSRCYLLDASTGLQQLTKDDLKSQGDALANLIEDSPMSNFINADVDFRINFRSLAIRLPIVMFAATDGCFNFVSSPAHFEFLLLKTLHSAENAEDWQSALREEIEKIAGDDATLSLVALGWRDFGEVKRAFYARLHEVHKTFVAPLGLLDEEIGWLGARLESREAERRRVREQLWREYKTNYERFLSDGGEKQ